VPSDGAPFKHAHWRFAWRDDEETQAPGLPRRQRTTTESFDRLVSVDSNVNTISVAKPR